MGKWGARLAEEISKAREACADKTAKRGVLSVLSVREEGVSRKFAGQAGPFEFRGAIKGECDEKDVQQFLATIKKEGGAPQRPYALSDAEGDLAHAEPWDEATCGRFVARVVLFMRRGMTATDADDLAERLHLRDVTRDDRRQCLECAHFRRNGVETCANSARADARIHGPHAVTMLQCCPGFAAAINEEG